MTSFGPSISRISCLGPRSLFQTCSKVDSLAARLAQQYPRPFSNASRCSWREIRTLNRIPPAQIPYTVRGQFRAYAEARDIITEYEDLPEDYEPRSGLPFRHKPLSQDEATSIFGKGVTAAVANRVLRALHGQRVAGTLQDPDSIRWAPFEKKLMDTGLQWLRDNVEVDEITNAGLRAEDEMRDMEENILEDAERIGIWKPNSGTPEGSSPYEKGVLETIREENKKAFEEEEEQKKNQADEIRESSPNHSWELQTQTPGSSQVELRRPGENPRLKYYLERAYDTAPEAPPEWSNFRRLAPSGLVVLGTLVGCWALSTFYEPPKNSKRMYPDIPPAAATLLTILAANTLVFCLWRFPPAYRLLNQHFIMLPGYPYPFSMIGNIFSHKAFYHLFLNMAVVYFVGTRLHDEIGRGNFLAVYLGSGVLASYASLSYFVLTKNFVSSSLGASGALCGIVACYLTINSSETVRFFGVFPPPDWPSVSSLGLLSLLIFVESMSVWRKAKSTQSIDHWSHMGGYATGIGAGVALNVRYNQRKNGERELQRAEKRNNMSIEDRIKSK
ncbi:Rhomboid protein [Lachnellula suecica]|uniref:Rhomboid protein n=1 Tax=Lachnellula suecica TaxID=602035 RepID=A0A8T9C2F7_9HELO|nr:Rhomboid protein [Lachnellula suecica]